jgi:hypothetical protein
MQKNAKSLTKYLSNVSSLYAVDNFFALANKNKITQLAKSLTKKVL